MDKDGYPDEKELKIIRDWDLLKSGVDGLLDFIEQIWWWPDWGFIRKGKKLELHTGGWSGNESIIAALESNLMFWILLWVKSERGGHYWFEIPDTLKNVAKEAEDEDDQKMQELWVCSGV